MHNHRSGDRFCPFQSKLLGLIGQRTDLDARRVLAFKGKHPQSLVTQQSQVIDLSVGDLERESRIEHDPAGFHAEPQQFLDLDIRPGRTTAGTFRPTHLQLIAGSEFRQQPLGIALPVYQPRSGRNRDGRSVAGYRKFQPRSCQPRHGQIKARHGTAAQNGRSQ